MSDDERIDVAEYLAETRAAASQDRIAYGLLGPSVSEELDAR